MTKILYLSGTAKWAKLIEPDKKFNNWTLDLYLDDKSVDNFKKAELELQLRSSDEGPFIKLRRPVAKLIKNELVQYDPPQVTDQGGNKVTALVGNGSKVTCKVEVFGTVKGNGHRLDAVRVDELVEYDPGGVIGDMAEDFVAF
jgi:hypothetical protein